jgi:hypothetical protein
MSDRFVRMLLLGALPLFFIGSYPAAFAYLGVFNLLAFSIWAWDRKQIRHNLLLIDREFTPQWAIGQPQRLTLALSSESGFPLKVDLHETMPESLAPALLPPAPPPARELDLAGAQEVALLALGVGLPGGADPGVYALTRRRPNEEVEEPVVESPIITLNVPLPLNPQSITLRPYAALRIAYALTPTVRGPLKLGQISVRLTGPLGLAWTQQKRELPRSWSPCGTTCRATSSARSLGRPRRSEGAPSCGRPWRKSARRW